MKDRRRRAAHISHERWLVSYADFVTLLFAFFVVLYASAQIDKQRALKLSNAIDSAFQQLGVFQPGSHQANAKLPLSSAVGAAVELPTAVAATVKEQDPEARKADSSSIRSELEKALAEEIKRNEVALHMEADGLVVSLRELGFFDSGSATLKPGAEAAFARVASILQEHSCAVRIEGHTDNVPIHTSQFASNWELSTARSTGLVRMLIEKYGVPAERLGNSSAKGRQLNRRVDVVILASSTPHLLADANASARGASTRSRETPGTAGLAARP